MKQAKTNKTRPIDKLLKEEGFILINNGGGFFCYSKSNQYILDDNYREILITALDLPEAPTSINEKIGVGFYKGKDCELIDFLPLKNIKYYLKDKDNYNRFLTEKEGVVI